MLEPVAGGGHGYSPIVRVRLTGEVAQQPEVETEEREEDESPPIALGAEESGDEEYLGCLGQTR